MVSSKQPKIDAFAKAPQLPKIDSFAQAPQIVETVEQEVKKKRPVRAIEEECRKFRSEWKSKYFY